MLWASGTGSIKNHQIQPTRFGALVDETGRFVWCCMDTYGGRDHPVNLLHVGGVGDVMDVG